MTKAELVEAMAKQADLTKADAAKALDAFLEAAATALKKDDKVTLVGFGTFSVKKRAARTGVNPRTREPIKIPASKTIGFTPGKALRETVNKKKK